VDYRRTLWQIRYLTLNKCFCSTVNSNIAATVTRDDVTTAACDSNWVWLATHAEETCTSKKFAQHKQFDASSSQFLAPNQLTGQSRCPVRVTCQTVSVLE